MAHPGRLRLIFRSKDKNDRKDAARLAKLLYLGEAPAVHVPTGVAVETSKDASSAMGERHERVCGRSHSIPRRGRWTVEGPFSRRPPQGVIERSLGAFRWTVACGVLIRLVFSRKVAGN